MRSASRFHPLVGALLLLAAPAAASDRPLPPSRPDLVLPPVPAVPEPTVLPAAPKGRALYLPLIEKEAKARGLPPEIADAVARVESGYDPGALGGVGERGLMQVLPSTAAMLGFRGGPADLADPATNVRLGVTYLAGAWKRADGDLCRTLMKYRAGHNEERMSALSVEYCRRAKSHLAALGSPLGKGALPAITLGSASVGTVGRGSRVRVASAPGRRLRGARFWAAHEARIRSIEARLPWRRGGILAGG